MSKTLFHLKEGLRALTCVAGQSALWYSVYNIGITWGWWQGYPRCKDLFLAVVGLGLVVADDSLVHQALANEELDRCDSGHLAEKPLSQCHAYLLMVKLYVQSLLTLLGMLMHTTGVWNFLDVDMYAAWSMCSTDDSATEDAIFGCLGRNSAFMGCGLVIMMATHTVGSTLGINIDNFTPFGMKPVRSRRTKEIKRRLQVKVRVLQKLLTCKSADFKKLHKTPDSISNVI